jgi:hypothetical protein
METSVGHSSQRPRSVVISVAIHAVSQAVGSVYYIVIGRGPHSVGIGLAWVVAIGVLVFYLRAIFAGHNWARWLSVAFAALFVAVLPWVLPTLGSHASKLVYLVQQAMDVTAAVLLLLPASGRWYRSDYSSKRTPKPLRGSGAA